jgi:DNA polymerase
VYLFEDYIISGYRKEHPALRIIPRQSPEKNVLMRNNGGKEKGESQVDKQSTLLSEKISQCKECSLHFNRKQALPGSGVLHPVIFIIGSKPGEEDDNTGKAFAGPTGDYLKKWLKAIGYSLEKDCFAAHLVRCNPPDNREPGADEIKTCFPFFQQQLHLLKPEIILALGEIPARILTGEKGKSLSELRGKKNTYQHIPLVVTYDPGSVLQDPGLRKPVWEDLKYLKHLLEKERG